MLNDLKNFIIIQDYLRRKYLNNTDNHISNMMLGDKSRGVKICRSSYGRIRSSRMINDVIIENKYYKVFDKIVKEYLTLIQDIKK
jgi:hypothetical protein